MNKAVITCEHYSNHIPLPYSPLFKQCRSLLRSHRGYDRGAASLFKALTLKNTDYSFQAKSSRLLIDLNRSLNHRHLFSSITQNLPPQTKNRIINTYYRPYRRQVERTIKKLIARQHTVVHISLHTFTPVLKTIVRNTDIGLLYDPKRRREKLFVRQLKKSLTARIPLKIRYNYPYRGSADGLTTYLRKQFPGKAYLGIEVEINQKIPLRNKKLWKLLKKNMTIALTSCIQNSLL